MKVLQVPYGTRDLLPGEAKQHRQIKNKIADTFEKWGYDEVRTPTFEYYDTFVAAGQNTENDYKLFDRHNNILVLRSDMTTPLARMVATRLKDKEVKRLFYLADVFRHAEAQIGRQCEFSQAGVELLGAEGACADAEILALAVRSLVEAGLKDFKISIGHIKFIEGLLEGAGLGAEDCETIKECLIEHDAVRLEAFIEDTEMDENYKKIFKDLLFMHGSTELLDYLDSLPLSAKSAGAVEDLRKIYALCGEYGVQEYLSFDMSLLRSLNYYTGMLFEGYTADMGFPIIGGGRYDNMMQNFGDSCPATGFAIGIERLMLVLTQRGEIECLSRWDVFVAWQEGSAEKAISESCRLRNGGRSVKLATKAMTSEEAEAARKKNNCDTLLYL